MKSWVGLAIAGLWLIVVGATIATANELHLGDRVKVMVGDDPAYAEPSFDDSDWPKQPVIQSGGWFARGATLLDRTLWQRVTFDGTQV